MKDKWGLFFFGGVFLLIGLLFARIGWTMGNRVDALEQLPVLTAASLSDSEPGQASTLEGRIAERNELQFRTFVAYVRERYEGEDCDDDGCEAIWREEERLTPPLLLDLSDGRVQVVNPDYYLESLPADWQTSEELVAYETIRYRGLEIGNPVFVVGESAPAVDVPAFAAEFIAGSDRAAYLGRERTGARLFFWLGILFSLIGGGVLGWLVKSLF